MKTKLSIKVFRKLFILSRHGFLNWMNDESYLKMMFWLSTGKKLNLELPQSFSEKLQWLKLHDRKKKYTTMVDKYAAKEYVRKIIGNQYIIPTLGVWERFEDIDFSKLPNQFVLKCTHDSGGLIICRDKSKLDIKAARLKMNKCLRNNYYSIGREWPYKVVKPRIIAEKYMTDSSSLDLRDYKFYCFNGEPKFCQVISDRSSGETIDFFDMNWEHQEFTGLAYPNKPFNNSPIPIPIQFHTMKKFAKILSNNTSFLRVDFYEIGNKLYFGELTFYPASGFGVFSPEKYDYIIGDMLKI